jgi:hypothetical protein
VGTRHLLQVERVRDPPLGRSANGAPFGAPLVSFAGDSRRAAARPQAVTASAVADRVRQPGERSSGVEHQLPKLRTRVRFPSLALNRGAFGRPSFALLASPAAALPRRRLCEVHRYRRRRGPLPHGLALTAGSSPPVSSPSGRRRNMAGPCQRAACLRCLLQSCKCDPRDRRTPFDDGDGDRPD